MTRDLFEKIILVVLASSLSYLAAWLKFRKDRGVKKEDDEDSESKASRAKLASDLETVQEGRAADLETTRHNRAVKLEAKAETTDDHLAKIDAELSALKSQIAPVNAAFTAILIKELTHFHTPVMDALMEKLGDEHSLPTITDDEEAQLNSALKERMADMGPEISDNERDGAEMLPVMIRRKKREAQAVREGAAFTAIQVVGILHDSTTIK
jgi:hypothetical protein